MDAQDKDQLPEDTPTHRLHLMQMSMQQIKNHTELLQQRRARIVNKIANAKKHTKLERELQINKQFKRLVTKMEKDLAGIEIDLDTVADQLNKARALFLEMSNGEVLLEKEVIKDGSA